MLAHEIYELFRHLNGLGSYLNGLGSVELQKAALENLLFGEIQTSQT